MKLIIVKGILRLLKKDEKSINTLCLACIEKIKYYATEINVLCLGICNQIMTVTFTVLFSPIINFIDKFIGVVFQLCTLLKPRQRVHVDEHISVYFYLYLRKNYFIYVS